jgi:hypothetical protein
MPTQSLEEVRQFIRDLDSQHCPVAQRQRQLREEKLVERAKDREARKQQRQAANISQEWIDERIHQYILQCFFPRGMGDSCGKPLAAQWVKSE